MSDTYRDHLLRRVLGGGNASPIAPVAGIARSAAQETAAKIAVALRPTQPTDQQAQMGYTQQDNRVHGVPGSVQRPVPPEPPLDPARRQAYLSAAAMQQGMTRLGASSVRNAERAQATDYGGSTPGAVPVSLAEARAATNFPGLPGGMAPGTVPYVQSPPPAPSIVPNVRKDTYGDTSEPGAQPAQPGEIPGSTQFQLGGSSDDLMTVPSGGYESLPVDPTIVSEAAIPGATTPVEGPHSDVGFLDFLKGGAVGAIKKWLEISDIPRQWSTDQIGAQLYTMVTSDQPPDWIAGIPGGPQIWKDIQGSLSDEDKQIIIAAYEAGGGTGVWESVIAAATDEMPWWLKYPIRTGTDILVDPLAYPLAVVTGGAGVLTRGALESAAVGKTVQAAAENVASTLLGAPQRILDVSIDAPFNAAGELIGTVFRLFKPTAKALEEAPAQVATEQINVAEEATGQVDRIKRDGIGFEEPPPEGGVPPTPDMPIEPTDPNVPRYTMDPDEATQQWVIKDPNGAVIETKPYNPVRGAEPNYQERIAQKRVNELNKPIIRAEDISYGSILPPEGELTWTDPGYQKLTNRGKNMPQTIQTRVADDMSLDPTPDSPTNRRRQWIDAWTPKAKQHEAVMADIRREESNMMAKMGVSAERDLVQGQRELLGRRKVYEMLRFYVNDSLIPFNETFPMVTQRARRWITSATLDPTDASNLIEHAVMGTREDAIQARKYLYQRNVSVEGFKGPREFIEHLGQMGERINGPGWRSTDPRAVKSRSIRARQAGEATIDPAAVNEITGRAAKGTVAERTRRINAFLDQPAERGTIRDGPIVEAVEVDPVAQAIIHAPSPHMEKITAPIPHDVDDALLKEIANPSTKSVTPGKNRVESTITGEIVVKKPGSMKTNFVRIMRDRKQGQWLVIPKEGEKAVPLATLDDAIAVADEIIARFAKGIDPVPAQVKRVVDATTLFDEIIGANGKLPAHIQRALDANTNTFGSVYLIEHNIPLVDVPLNARFVATHDHLYPGKMQEFIDDPLATSDLPPIAIRDNGTYYVVSGHHRTGAAKLRGEPTFPMRVIDATPSGVTSDLGKTPGGNTISQERAQGDVTGFLNAFSSNPEIIGGQIEVRQNGIGGPWEVRRVGDDTLVASFPQEEPITRGGKVIQRGHEKAIAKADELIKGKSRGSLGIVPPSVSKTINMEPGVREDILRKGGALEGSGSAWLSRDDLSYIGAAHQMGKLDDATYTILNQWVEWSGRTMKLWEAYDDALQWFSTPEEAKRAVASQAVSPEIKAILDAKELAVKNRGAGKRALFKALTGYEQTLRFLREAIMFNWARGPASAFADMVGNANTLALNGEAEAAVRGLDLSIARHFINDERGKKLVIDNLPGMERYKYVTGFEPPASVIQLVETRFETGHPGLALEGLGRAYNLVRPIADKDIKAFRVGADRNNRFALHMSSFDRNLNAAQIQFRGIVATKAQRTGNDYVDWLRKLDQLGDTYNPDDVLHAFGDQRLARDWRELTSKARMDAKQRVDQLLFSYKMTNADNALRNVVFFHYWMSRAIPLHAKTAFKNPWLLNAYARTWERMEAEAEANGYPPNVRGFIRMQGSKSGFYGLINPIQVLVPFGMLIEGNDDPGVFAFLKRWGFFINPVIEGAAASLGWTQTMPDVTGTMAIRRAFRYTVNWLNSNGHEGLVPDVLGDPNSWQPSIVDEAQYRIIDQINTWAQRAANALAPSQRIVSDYEGSSKNAYEYDVLNSVLINELEKQYGPFDQWGPESPAWNEFLQAKDDIAMGRDGNVVADAVVEIMADAKIENTIEAAFIPGGVYQRYGPRDETLAEMRASKERVPADDQYDLATSGNAELAVGLQQLDKLGTENGRQGYKLWNEIAYGDIKNDEFLRIHGEYISGLDLNTMTTDARERLADRWIAQYDEMEGYDEVSKEVETYRGLRDEFLIANPQAGDFKEYQKNVGNFEGGTTAWRTMYAKKDAAFGEAMGKQEARWRGQGKTGDVLDKELDRWAMTPEAYNAANGNQDSIYDAPAKEKVPDYGFPAEGQYTSAKKDPMDKLADEIGTYQEKLAVAIDAMNAAGYAVTEEDIYTMSPFYATIFKNFGVPNPSSDVMLYLNWSAHNPGHNSIDEFIQYLEGLAAKKAA